MSHQHSHDHSHDHQHSHDDHGHSHSVSVTEDSKKRVLLVLLLTGSYMLVQVVGALFSGSLALLADAGHMLSDTTALALAWVAFRLAAKPADQRRSYGYGRFQILAAFINGLALFVIAFWITIEAWQRLQQPGEILAGPMLIVAIVGLLVNVAGFIILHRGNRDNVNMRGALLHVLGDLLGSVAAIVAAVVIMFTGWMAIDPILAVFVALLILRSAWDLVKRSGHILLEGTPDGVDPAQVEQSLQKIDGVQGVHHLHIWAITGEEFVASLHVQIVDAADADTVLKAVQQQLQQQFSIAHSTVQIEREYCGAMEHA